MHSEIRRMARAAGLLLAVVLFSVQAGAAPRNVVIFIGDDHGLDAGAYGNTVVRTPAIDALAAEGMVFRYAFATTASCSASRSVILSGLHNHRNGQYGHQHDFHHFASFEHVKSLPVLLAEAGYATAIAGKFHVAPESVYHFDTKIPGDSRNAVQMAENSRAFIRKNRDRPFFLYVATSDPHRGGGFADELPHAPDRFGNRPGGYAGVEEVAYHPDDVSVPDYLPDTPTARAEIAQYYQAVSRLDQGLGRLVEILKTEGVYDNTLLIYMSDHGPAFPGAKTTVYEPGLRSPLVVRLPATTYRGMQTDAMVSWVDITPTVLDFAGVSAPEYENHVALEWLAERLPRRHGLHGRSFLPVLMDGDAAGRDEIYASHTFHEIQMYYPMRVVRDREYKLIWNVAHELPFPFASDLWAAPTWQTVYALGPEAMYGPRTVRAYISRPAFELYDMQADPLERENLALDPGNASILQRYTEKLRAFQVRTSDPWLLKSSYE